MKEWYWMVLLVISFSVDPHPILRLEEEGGRRKHESQTWEIGSLEKVCKKGEEDPWSGTGGTAIEIARNWILQDGQMHSGWLWPEGSATWCWVNATRGFWISELQESPFPAPPPRPCVLSVISKFTFRFVLGLRDEVSGLKFNLQVGLHRIAFGFGASELLFSVLN